MHDPDTRHEWVSVKQAAIHFGTSESDIRRRIKRGELMSESLARPGGTLLRVRLDAPADAAHIEEAAAPDTRQPNPEALQIIASALLAKVDERDATIAAKDAEIARINAENADLREERGRLTAELEARAESLEWTQALLDQERAEAAWRQLPWWKRLGGRPPA